MNMTYINLRLTLDPLSEGHYRATLDHETNANPAPVEFSFTPQEKIGDGSSFQDYFDRINDLKAQPEDLRTVGGALYQKIFQGELNGTFKTWLEEIRKNGRKYRLRLDIRSPELVDVPWELLYLDAKNYFLARQGNSIVRYMTGAARNEVSLSANLRVLIVSASPSDMNFDQDEQTYIEPLKSFFESYNIIPDVMMGADATYDNLRQQLKNKYDIFHFMGHGKYQRGVGKVFLLGKNGRSQELESGDLGHFLSESQVQLAFLCSCQTSRTTPATVVKPDQIKSPFRGVAQNLIGAGVPAVVAMQYNFPETEDTLAFVNTFYKELLASNSIDQAMGEARLAIRGGQLAWCIPTLYSQFNIGQLLAKPVLPQSQEEKEEAVSDTKQPEAPPKVFISYSWDSSEHLERVRALSDRLRREGIDANLDQYVTSPSEGWPLWMERQVRTSDFVLVVCTKTYLRRFQGEESLGKGHGVRWESLLTAQHLYNAGATNAKFIPILLGSSKFADIPTPLQGFTYYQVDQGDGYELLYRHLTNQPRNEKPALGSIRSLPPLEPQLNWSTPPVVKDIFIPGKTSLALSLLNVRINKWLDGYTETGAVNLAPSPGERYTGTLWELHELEEQAYALECKGHLPGPKWLFGMPGQRSVLLVKDEHLRQMGLGIRWKIFDLGSGKAALKCMDESGEAQWLSVALDGRVELSPDQPLIDKNGEGAHWKIVPGTGSQTNPIFKSELPGNFRAEPIAPQQSNINVDTQIKKILEGLHAFKDPRDRQLVIENIPVDLRRRFHGNERPVDMASVFTDLFKRYSRHRSALLEAINYIESDSDDFKDLESLVKNLK